MSRLTRWRCAASTAAVLVGAVGLVTLDPSVRARPPVHAAPVRVPAEFSLEVVVTGIPRPAQLALTTSGRLVVLSHGWRGDAAAEIFSLDLAGGVPIDATLAPRIVVPFADGPRKIAFGSLAVDHRTGDLFLGEENGNRIYRLTADQRLLPLAVGFNHLLGGSSLATDPEGRVVALDYASLETQLRSESPLPPSLHGLATEDYTGPLVFRLDPEADVPLPRRLELVAPIFPKRPGPRVPGPPLHRFIAVAPLGHGELALLSSPGEVFILTAQAALRPLARLPSGHYHRTNMAVGPDGSLLVSSGFHIRQIFRVSPTGVVTTVARDLGDPQGIAVDRAGAVYVAETALHRIIRLVPTAQ